MSQMQAFKMHQQLQMNIKESHDTAKVGNNFTVMKKKDLSLLSPEYKKNIRNSSFTEMRQKTP